MEGSFGRGNRDDSVRTQPGVGGFEDEGGWA